MMKKFSRLLWLQMQKCFIIHILVMVPLLVLWIPIAVLSIPANLMVGNPIDDLFKGLSDAFNYKSWKRKFK